MIMQCESSFQINKRKRKVDGTSGKDLNYLYSIVTTETEWYFLLYSSHEISCTSKNPFYINLTKDSEDDLGLCKM